MNISIKAHLRNLTVFPPEIWYTLFITGYEKNTKE